VIGITRMRFSGPDEIKVLSSAFEEALRELRLVDRTDPATQVVAKRIIELAQQGERTRSDCARVSPRLSETSHSPAAPSQRRKENERGLLRNAL
jgi:hypothetical protein